MYSLLANGYVLLTTGSTTTCIPPDVTNSDWRDFLAWEAAGNVPTPYSQPPPAIPQTVTPYQARVALLNANRLDQVNALMANSGTPQQAVLAWEYATVIERNSAFISTLGPALGLTDAQIDALFTAAAAIT